MSIITPFCYAQELGKLFTSAEQRQYLDYLREDYIASSTETGFNIDEPQIPEIPLVEEIEQEVDEGPENSVYQFGGIMHRSDNSKIIWLNRQQFSENNMPDGFRLVARDNEYLLQFSNEGNTFLIKPGQTLNIVTGRVIEAYQYRNAIPSSPQSSRTQLLPGNTQTSRDSDTRNQTLESNTDGPDSNDSDEESLPDRVANLLDSLQVQ